MARTLQLSSAVGGVWVWQRWLHILMSCTYIDLCISESNQCNHSEFTSPFQKILFPWRSESKADENQDAWSTAQHSGWRGEIISPLSVSGLFTLSITTQSRGSHAFVQQTTHAHTHKHTPNSLYRITELNARLFTTSSLSTACKN